MSNDDYDPGTPYEPPSYRRRRQRGGDQDDAWAAADENDYYDDDVEIGDLAAGYVDEEQIRRRHYTDSPGEWHDGDQWSSSVDRARARGRSSRHPNRGANYNRADVYGRSPTYYRDRMKRGEYGEYHAGKRKFSPYESSPGLHLGFHIPFWQILIIVILSLAALFAVALACITILLI